jgi:DNA ligase (NAD+)
VRERIERWCSPEAMDIAGADKALVARLVNGGLVRDVAELYSLKLAEVAALEGRDQNFARDFLEAVAASKSREAWRVLYGLSIPLVDLEVASQLCRQFAALDDILPAGPERMMQPAGVAEAVARSIAQWYGDGANRRLVRRLQKAGVNFKTGT